MTSKQTKLMWGIFLPVGLAAIAVLFFFVWLYTGAWTPAKEAIFSRLPFPVGRVGQKLVMWPTLKGLAGQAGGNESPRALFTGYVNSQKDSILLLKAQGRPQANTEPKTALEIAWTANKSLNSAGFSKLLQIQKRLRNGESFSAVSNDGNDDPATALFGGDAGFVDPAHTLPEFENGLVSLKPGTQTVIPTRRGLYVVFVDEISEDPAGAKPLFHLHTILIGSEGFGQWYSQERASIRSSLFRK